MQVTYLFLHMIANSTGVFTVYVLYSRKYRKIYIGYTSSLEQRIKSHNIVAVKGFTSKFRPWTLIHVEEFHTKRDAMAREKELKSARGRAFIWELISRTYP